MIRKDKHVYSNQYIANSLSLPYLESSEQIYIYTGIHESWFTIKGVLCLVPYRDCFVLMSVLFHMCKEILNVLSFKAIF